MAMKKLKLEDIQIRQWVKNNIRFDARSDGGGLYLRYREVDNAPVWFFRFKIAGIEQKIILGKFPSMSLSKARKEVVGLRADILRGNNPAADKREVKRQAAAQAIADQSAQTVTELVDEYFRRNVEDKCKTAKAMRGRVNKYLIPVIGKMRIDAVEPMHISNMLDRIIKAGAPTTANDVLSYSKQIFNHAIKRHIIKHNPAAAFDIRDAGGTERARERFLSQDEITKFFKAMSESEKFTRHHYLCTKLLLITGCRKGELFKAKRTDFDLTAAVWRMSLENKTNSAITIPLPSQAVAIISELIQFQIDGSEYLLPAQSIRTSKSGYISESYLNKPIKNWVFPLMVDVPNFHIHDLRATMKSHMGKMGIDRFVSERCLNHKIVGMEGVYDRGDYFNERKAALALWADFLDSCEQSGKLC
jgi:integrase